ncbi:DNA/RNA nuclease SfsA [Marinicellulosiphila megalodicopiae]|uniref:DNA/RNA nuclease SfsA n=1 Tax=Marinicellulosiphila megalodicopiae TaxID=2724896 RepID=UPI003BB191A5
MNFPTLLSGRLIKRYKRFFADILLDDGSTIITHCPNTGSMKGLLQENSKVWYSTSDNPKRKLKFTWELIEVDHQHLACIQTNRANAIIKEGIENGVIQELSGYENILTEQKYGEEKSRIDILMCNHPTEPNAYIEVKNVTLLEDSQGYFPDSVTTRGHKHLRELILMKQQGFRAVLLFHVAHQGIHQVEAAKHIDPTYHELLYEAHKKGVEILAYKSNISPDQIFLDKQVHVII